MIFGYSVPALQRLDERGLTKEIVEETVSNPDKLVRVDDLSKAIKHFDDKVLIVIFKEINGIPFVITAYNSSDLSRYFK